MLNNNTPRLGFIASFEDIVGDPAPFLDRIFAGLASVGINVDSYMLDHVCYRVATEEEYESAKRKFEALGSRLLVENIISGRMIATYKLSKPYMYKGRAIDVVELPSVRACATRFGQSFSRHPFLRL